MKVNSKNGILIGGITIALALSSHAAVVYSTDFDITYNNANGAFVLGGGVPDVVAEDWFGSSNQVGIAGGDLSFSNSTANRYRGSGVWLDTTGWATGLVTVEVDVTNFFAGADTSIIFQAYAALGVDASNTVSLDLHGAVSAGSSPTATGTATIGTLGAEQTITAGGTDVPFTFNFNGTDEFIALTFVQINAVGGTSFGSADLDNLTVTTIPEPSSTALLGLGGFALLLRRRK